jgi:hypothetical protein
MQCYLKKKTFYFSHHFFSLIQNSIILFTYLAARYAFDDLANLSLVASFQPRYDNSNIFNSKFVYRIRGISTYNHCWQWVWWSINRVEWFFCKSGQELDKFQVKSSKKMNWKKPLNGKIKFTFTSNSGKSDYFYQQIV